MEYGNTKARSNKNYKRSFTYWARVSYNQIQTFLTDQQVDKQLSAVLISWLWQI